MTTTQTIILITGFILWVEMCHWLFLVRRFQAALVLGAVVLALGLAGAADTADAQTRSHEVVA